jgi:hypothetical protein
MIHNEHADSHNDATAGNEQIPLVREQVWVQCGDYRTLAYLDEKGVWRTVAKGEEIKVTKVLGGG